MLVRTKCFIAALAVATLCVTSVGAQVTTLVSTDSLGIQGDDQSYKPSISGDGRYIAFESLATNLVHSDTNGFIDIFVHDTQTGQTTRVSVGSSGAQGNADSYKASICASGRFIAFESEANTLANADTNGTSDAFVHDMQTGQTFRASVNSGGTQGNGWSSAPSISADGRFIAFLSEANNLAAGDTNGVGDIFLHDTQTGQTSCVSVSSSGTYGNHRSYEPAISASGRFVVFSSYANNLISGDTNQDSDVFVRDVLTGQTTRVSGTSGGTFSGNDDSYSPSISQDGRLVAFRSYASNLVTGDTNGWPDIFVHDSQTGQFTRVSVDSFGVQGIGDSSHPSISADGRFVTFQSNSSNLVLGDTNANRDVFEHDMQSGQTVRVSVYSGGGQSGGDNYASSISSDGRFVAFDTSGTFASGDVNLMWDVYLYEALGPCYVDADLDGFGTGSAAFFSTTGCGAGYSPFGTDCDDGIATVHPFAAEICNGIDDNCDGDIDEGFISTYCTSSTTTHSCTPAIGYTGTPSSTQSSGFSITIGAVEGHRTGLLFYGLSPTSTPWYLNSTSYLCIVPPLQRMLQISSGGIDGSCDGVLSEDWNSWRASHSNALGSPFSAGQVFYAQAWFRDPGAPSTTNLSDGLRFTLAN